MTRETKMEELLAKYGWQVECESPLEIRHSDGSFASGRAAHIVGMHYAEAEESESIGGAGDKLICLGKMLNSPDSTIQELVSAGMECGLIVTFRVEPNPVSSCETYEDGTEKCQCEETG
jgi:hypothetical protein